MKSIQSGCRGFAGEDAVDDHGDEADEHSEIVVHPLGYHQGKGACHDLECGTRHVDGGAQECLVNA